VGGWGSVEERLIARTGLPFIGIPAGGIHGLAPWRAARNLFKLAQGFGVALRAGRRRRPDALFVTGGYASVPVALAAWSLRVPVLLYLPDIEPGLAVRFIARLATRIAVTTEASRAFFPAHKVVVTGYPVRPEFAGIHREPSREVLGLASDKPVLLVFGGSTGARSINRAVADQLEGLLEVAQVVHVSGERDWSWVAERAEELPPALRQRYHPYPYLHDEAMGQALAAADLALCRAGASTLGELPYFGLPAILVPYPYAWRYQKVNADWLASRGAAVVLEDARLGEALLPTVQALLTDADRLAEMRARTQTLARPDAAARLAEILHSLISSHHRPLAKG